MECAFGRIPAKPGPPGSNSNVFLEENMKNAFICKPGIKKHMSFHCLAANMLVCFALATTVLGHRAASRSLSAYVDGSRIFFQKSSRRFLKENPGVDQSVVESQLRVPSNRRSRPEQQQIHIYSSEKADKQLCIVEPQVQPARNPQEQLKRSDQEQQSFQATAATNTERKMCPLLLRYTACSGLINQHYSAIAAFALAAMLSADIVLPPSLYRNSFKHYFSVRATENRMTWSKAPSNSLLDVSAAVKAWEQEGVHVFEAPTWAPLPNTSAPAEAYPTYPHPGADPRLTARVSGVYLQPRDLDALAQAALEEAARVRAAVKEQDPGHGSALVVLDLPCTMFAVRSESALPLMSKVARSLEFNPSIKRLAERVTAALEREGGQQGFNGAHLRLEKDAFDWQRIMGGAERYWKLHIQAMQTAGFNSTTPLYVACGLLSYGAHHKWDLTVQQIRARGLGSAVWSKEEVLSQQELDALNTEQKALVDLLVLARARRLVGFGASSFSFFLREYRALHGLPRDSTVLVNASRVGTDSLFARAGVLAPPDAVTQ